MNRQGAYELFLDGVQRREDACLRRYLPLVLDAFVTEIKAVKIDHPNWETKSLPRLREAYRLVKSLIESKPREALTKLEQELLFAFNGWGRTTGYWLRCRRVCDNASRTRSDPNAVYIKELKLEREATPNAKATDKA
jgi:hypothetical protein